MKKYIYILCVFGLIILNSCENLDREVITNVSEQQVTDSYTYTMYRATAIYTTIQDGFMPINGAMMASATDEAEHTLETASIQRFNAGSWNAINNPDDVWSNYYQGIRRANLFLEKSDSVNLDVYKLDPNPAQQLIYTTRSTEIKRWKYEVRFLRAYYYSELVKRYGGVPVITKSLSLNEDYKSIKRNTLDSCIRFITNECDSAAKVLPAPSGYAFTDMGRVTKNAALALKSRVLLYAASDLFNTPAVGYAHPELVSLTGDRQLRWKAAADAAKVVIDLKTNIFGSSYSTLFGPTSYMSSEAIFVRRNSSSNSFEVANYPIGYDLGQSGTTPSQNLVDAYEVKVNATTSIPFDWNNPTHAANPYANRDPRLGFSILVNNTTFKGRPVECWTGGKDGKGVVNASKTGYYLNKYIDPTLNLLTGTTSVHSWVLIRLTEMYLNYAEALNEYSPGNADILTYVNKVRARTGVAMPAIPAGLTQDQMRDKIRHERQVEFAFENFRAWDARRWMKGPEILGTPLRGVEITKTGTSTFKYTPVVVEQRVFDPKMYFYPIPQNEININNQIIQNPGW